MKGKIGFKEIKRYEGRKIENDRGIEIILKIIEKGRWMRIEKNELNEYEGYEELKMNGEWGCSNWKRIERIEWKNV